MLNVGHKKVLIVEDEFLIASELEWFFADAGAEVLGPFDSLTAAAAYVDIADAAVLDVKIADGFVYPLADRLMERRKPICFYSGYEQQLLPPRFQNVSFVSKPQTASVIIDSLATPVSGAVVDELPELRAAARRLARDKITGDRLVELTLETALRNITMSDDYASVGDWLRAIMHAIFRQEESDYLH